MQQTSSRSVERTYQHANVSLPVRSLDSWSRIELLRDESSVETVLSANSPIPFVRFECYLSRCVVMRRRGGGVAPESNTSLGVDVVAERSSGRRREAILTVGQFACLEDIVVESLRFYDVRYLDQQVALYFLFLVKNESEGHHTGLSNSRYYCGHSCGT